MDLLEDFLDDLADLAESGFFSVRLRYGRRRQDSSAFVIAGEMWGFRFDVVQGCRKKYW